MRKTVMIMAVLALAGCDAGGSKSAQSQPSPQQASQSTAAPQVPVSEVARPKWFIQMNSREAVSDTSAWLLERGYAPVIVVIDGKQQMLLGPYESDAQAQEQLVALQAKVAKSHRFTSPSVIQRSE